jgi:hypothetical protein
MRSRIIAAMLCIAASASTGCTTRLGDLSVMSNRNMSAPIVKGPRVNGSDCIWHVFGIPFGTPNIEAATDDAMHDDPQAEFMTDVTLKASAWSVLLLGQSCYEVEGTLARPQTAADGMQMPIVVPAPPIR